MSKNIVKSILLAGALTPGVLSAQTKPDTAAIVKSIATAPTYQSDNADLQKAFDNAAAFIDKPVHKNNMFEEGIRVKMRLPTPQQAHDGEIVGKLKDVWKAAKKATPDAKGHLTLFSKEHNVVTVIDFDEKTVVEFNNVVKLDNGVLVIPKPTPGQAPGQAFADGLRAVNPETLGFQALVHIDGDNKKIDPDYQKKISAGTGVPPR